MKQIHLYIPTLNAGKRWKEVLASIAQQRLQPNKKILIDSGSTDDTVADALAAGFTVINVNKSTFDHGGTRDDGIRRFPEADIYVLMTHDAILADEYALENIIAVFEDERIGMAYGRQLPHVGAKTLESHARLFNYPAQSQIRTKEDADKYGIKTISCSNSFAAYRRTAYNEVQGFPHQIILGEDVVIAGTMLLNNWKMAYVSQAMVRHSHNYTANEEFERYFDIGVFHADHPWIFDHFGKANHEGLKYIQSEFAYILRHHVAALPKFFVVTLCKWLGYKLGLKYKKLPKRLVQRFSMQKFYWK